MKKKKIIPLFLMVLESDRNTSSGISVHLRHESAAVLETVMCGKSNKTCCEKEFCPLQSVCEAIVCFSMERRH